MKKFDFASFPLYRWRYPLTYVAVGLLFFILLVLALFYVPGGTTKDEMQQAVISSTLAVDNLTPEVVKDLPFHALQKLSFLTFGMSYFSMKLPSLLLGALTALAFSVLLHRWFRPNVAALTTILVISTGLFVFLSQNGTPTILYVLWPTLLLLFSTLIAQRTKHQALWHVLLAITIAASLYSPASIYIIISLFITALLHPKLRLALKKFSPQLLVLPLLLLGVLLLPLIILVAQSPSWGLSLLGIPVSTPDFTQNLSILFRQFFDFVRPSSGALMTPILGLGALALVALGAYRLLKSRYTIRTYTILIWILLLLPVIIINPAYSPIVLVPLILLMATGIDTLIRQWYILFPRNPYARVVGLLPLILLITTLTGAGIERYVYGYHYDPETAVHFSRDIRILERTVATIEGDHPITLITTDSEKEFYEVFTKENRALLNRKASVSTSGSENAAQTTIYTHDAKNALQPQATPAMIATSTRKSDADRFYIYKTDEK